MKKLLPVLLLFVSLQSIAQSWCPPGATWHYEYYNFFMGTCTVSYEGDTLIANTMAQKLKIVDQSYYSTMDGTLVAGVPLTGWSYTSQSGDSVFWWKNGEFFLLYDFGAVPGDSWTIHNNHGSDMYCDSLSIVSVIDTGHVIISASSLRYIDVEMLGTPNYAISGRAIERIGLVGTYNIAGFLLPLQRDCDTNSIPEYFWWDFICYEDDNFSLYNPAPHACDYYESIVGIEELKSGKKTIEKVYDLLGREVSFEKNQLLIVLYSDGSTEKVFVTE